MLSMQRFNPVRFSAALMLVLVLILTAMLSTAMPAAAQTDEPTSLPTEESTAESEPSLENCLLDLVITLDESPSIGPSFDDSDDEFSFVIGFATGLIDGLPVNEENVNVGVVLYDQTPATLLPITDDSDLAIETLESYDRQETSGTALAQGIDLAVLTLNRGRPAVQDVIVLLADGDDNQIGEPQTAADAARGRNIQIFSVAVGDELNLDQLAAVANDPDEDFFFQAEDFSELAGLIDSINRNACGVPSTLSGVVFADDDQDAELDSDETGVEGVTVSLYAADELATPAVPDQVTDADGVYTFQVAPGDYVVEIAQAPRPLVDGSLFDAISRRTEPLTVDINDAVEDINAPLAPLLEPTSTVTATVAPPTFTPTSAASQGPRYIQFNHPDDVSVAAGERPLLTVQLGNVGEDVLNDLVVTCRISTGQALFTGTANTNNVFGSFEASPSELFFSGLSDVAVGQNYNFDFEVDPVAGVSRITCELLAADVFLDSDTQQVSIRQ